MKANAFLVDLLWDVHDPKIVKEGGIIGALFLDTYGVADDYKLPGLYGRYEKCATFNVFDKHRQMNRARIFRNTLVISSPEGGRLLDMRDAIPANHMR